MVLVRLTCVGCLALLACDESVRPTPPADGALPADAAVVGDGAPPDRAPAADGDPGDGAPTDSAGDGPGLAPLQTLSSVTQYGITWTFADPAQVGQFVNGDYYVVGPVTVVDVDPAPLYRDEVPDAEIGPRERDWRSDGEFVRNGSMVNPPAEQRMAYDSAIRNYFDPALIQQPPYALTPGDTLVSTISVKMGERFPSPLREQDEMWREHEDDSPVRTAAALTCVDQAQPIDAFRPSYVDTQNKIYLARDLQRNLLPALSCPTSIPAVADLIALTQRPWVNTGWFGFDNPVENMPHYGREVGRAVGIAALLLACDIPALDKEQLLINLVQVGIDYWGVVRGGHPGWEAWGGHHSGRKLPVVLAGLLLGDPQMASPTTSFPDVSFQEDEQTGYGTGWTGASVVFQGHSGINNKTGQPARPQWGPYEHLHPSEWDADNQTSESYRRCCSSLAWVGQALALRLLHAEAQWAHDAWFDYVDRWMTEDDSAFVQTIQQETGQDFTADWARQGQCWDDFVEQMWASYRDNLP